MKVCIRQVVVFYKIRISFLMLKVKINNIENKKIIKEGYYIFVKEKIIMFYVRLLVGVVIFIFCQCGMYYVCIIDL